MSLMSGVFTIPSPLSNRHAYFRKPSRWPGVPTSRSSPRILTMEFPTAPPIASDDGVLRLVGLTNPGLPMWPNHPEGDQDVAVPEHLPQRPMVPTSAGDWESRKKIIRELYMDQNMILNEVIEIMITKYKFKATYVISPAPGSRSPFVNAANPQRENVQGPVCEVEMDQIQQDWQARRNKTGEVEGIKEEECYCQANPRINRDAATNANANAPIPARLPPIFQRRGVAGRNHPQCLRSSDIQLVRA